jgi:hypothetical protein
MGKKFNKDSNRENVKNIFSEEPVMEILLPL